MITPVWGSAYPPKPGWTTFHLRLTPSENGTDLSAQLSGLRPTLLLFLRQLRSLNVIVTGVAQHGALQIRREDGPGDDLVKLERIDNGVRTVERYVLMRHLAETPAQEPGREGVEKSEIILAFPVTESGEPVIEMQEVHAFLPLRCYGFNVSPFSVWVHIHNVFTGNSSSYRQTSSPRLAERTFWHIKNGTKLF
jgi:hypothetical protein